MKVIGTLVFALLVAQIVTIAIQLGYITPVNKTDDAFQNIELRADQNRELDCEEAIQAQLIKYGYSPKASQVIEICSIE